MTNKEKFVEVFGYSGNIVNKVKPYKFRSSSCYVPGTCGYFECLENCASRNFPRCPMWWNDEYKEEKNVSS